MLYFVRYGPTAVKQFAQFVADQWTAGVPQEELVLNIDILSSQFPVKLMFSDWRDLRGVLQGVTAAPQVVQIGKRLSRREQLARWDVEHEPVKCERQSLVIATPKTLAVVNDDVWGILREFTDPKSIDDVVSLKDKDSQDQVRSFLWSALAHGWLKPRRYERGAFSAAGVKERRLSSPG
jgi:hypothetical protein